MLTGVVDRRVNCRAANVEPSRGRSLEQESDDRCETKNARTNKLLMLSSLGLDIPPSCTSEQANQVLHRRSQPRVTVATRHDDLPNLRIGRRPRITAFAQSTIRKASLQANRHRPQGVLALRCELPVPSSPVFHRGFQRTAECNQ